ncbi:MAG: T9SS sorting signal type C domain-containing protein, partial [Flavobacterium sp.]|nr:T9SS sorting signal type C domain-containing protein [Flavobacterium sp.]
HDLKSGSYNFTSTAGVFDSRFQIRFVNEPELNVSDFEDATTILIYSADGIHIKSPTENIQEVRVFDVLGKQLYSENIRLASTVSITSLMKQNQVLVVQVSLENGSKVTEKVIH